MPDAARPVAAPTVKCLIWDLDDTVWDGTLLEGDDIRPRAEVCQVITELDSRGILHSVCSRNDYDLAWARLGEFGLDSYFVYPQIGFGRKSDAVRQIADLLQFDLGALAFIDDQAAERAEVQFHLPRVRCYSADQVSALTALPEFRPAVVTADARARRQMYQASHRRDAAQASFAGPDQEFARSLDMRLNISRASAGDLSRVEELTLRTSQMNATGVHYPAEALRALVADPAHEVLVTTLTDRFGPYGTVGVILLEKKRGAWHIKLLITSCRVMSRGAGAVILDWLTHQAARSAVHLVADYRPTPRNRIAELAYRFAGFDESSCPCQSMIAAPADPAVQRLHTTGIAGSAPATMTVTGPDLTLGADGGASRR